MACGYVSSEFLGRLFHPAHSRKAFAVRSLAEILICSPHFESPLRVPLTTGNAATVPVPGRQEGAEAPPEQELVPKEDLSVEPDHGTRKAA